MEVFPKRRYKSLKQYWLDLSFIFQQLPAIRSGIHKTLDPAFRERLMLIVSQFNDCPHCLHLHSKLAKAAGVPAFDIREIIAGQIPQGAPTDELPALHYARNWVENNAKTDTEDARKLIASYGEEKTRAIQLALGMIWIGNLSGNTFDYFRFRLSLGRWGND